MNELKKIYTAVVLAAVAVIVVATLAAGPAMAAKGGASTGGGKGGGKHTPTPAPSTATVVLTSTNPVPLGTAPSFHASGYKPGDYVYFQMSGGYVRVDGVYADSTGSADYTFYQPMTVPGTFTMTTTLLNGVNKASVTFSVQ